MKAVTAEQMRAIEQRSAGAGVSLDALMENAGLAVANAVADRLERVYGSRVTVLVGPGNNGSDGLVAARHLARRGAKVSAFAVSKRPEHDVKREMAEEAGIEFATLSGGGMETLRKAASQSDVVIDAVLGTGRAREIVEPLSSFLAVVGGAAKFVVALDLPTGMDANSGRFDPNGLRADLTLMLGFPKIGPLVTAGKGACGEISVLDIGIPDGLADDVPAELLTGVAARQLLPDRAGDANKGSFGRTLIAGGSRNYVGALLLAAQAAVRSGAGLVFVASAEPVYRLIAGRVEEAIYLPLAATEIGDFALQEASLEMLSRLRDMSSALIGPGLGQSPATVQFVEQVVRNLPESVPVVLDADALNILGRMPGWSNARRPQTVLTPHPGELARLFKTTVQVVQSDRSAAVLEAARRFDSIVVLKGAATLIATPDGRLWISPWVNPGLAKGGTGDVLAGLLAGLLAQTADSPLDAALLAVYLHGLAGDIARNHVGQRGMTAGDVAVSIPEAFRSLEG